MQANCTITKLLTPAETDNKINVLASHTRTQHTALPLETTSHISTQII